MSGITGNAVGAAGEPVLAGALLQPDCYPHPVTPVRLIETHISWVLLTGTWAYKIKKPVNLGFLDFTTLASRQRYCEAELRLNRRLTPGIYDSVVEIRGTPEHPRIDGAGPLLEYAVRMREFPQEALASEMLARQAFTARHVDLLAQGIAAFHQSAARAGSDSPFGTLDAVREPALENVETLQGVLEDEGSRASLRTLRGFTEREYALRRETFMARREAGFVRECHGDLHLRNIVVIDGRPVAFDCIEFDDRLRWIDVMSEVAFMAMDLEDRGRRDLAWRFLNVYLESTGDYGGIAVLRFYLVYRALVRAKVHALRARQPRIASGERLRLEAAAQAYITLAARCAAPATPALLITHGVSGSGKTTATQTLLGSIGAVRVRSDIERKRLSGLTALARSRSAPGGGIYTGEFTAVTYERLLSLARSILEAGHTALVDAAFLRRAERDAFRALAATLRVPFLILAFGAPEGVLRERVTQRFGGGTDASEADVAVLERQLEFQEPIGRDEEAVAMRIDTAMPPEPAAWARLLQRVCGNRQ